MKTEACKPIFVHDAVLPLIDCTFDTSSKTRELKVIKCYQYMIKLPQLNVSKTIIFNVFETAGSRLYGFNKKNNNNNKKRKEIC